MLLLTLPEFLSLPSRENNLVYLLGRDGIYIYYENEIFRVCKKIFNHLRISAPDIKKELKIEEDIKIKRKIPRKIFDTLLDYYDKNRKEEHALLIVMDENGGISLVEPDQDRSLAHVTFKMKYGLNVLATIHNHPFKMYNFSSTDDNDIKTFIGYDILVSYANDRPFIPKSRISLLGKVIYIDYRNIFEF